MNVNLRPEIETYVKEKIASGQFADLDDALNHALQSMRDQERLSDGDVVFLRKAMKVGLSQLDNGEGQPWDAADLKNRVTRFADAQSKQTGT